MLQYLHSKQYKVRYTIRHSVRHTIRHSVRHSARHTISHSVRHTVRHSVTHTQDYAGHDDHMEGGILLFLFVMRDKCCWQVM